MSGSANLSLLSALIACGSLTWFLGRTPFGPGTKEVEMSTNSRWQRFLKGGAGRRWHAKRFMAFVGLAVFLVAPLLIAHDRQVVAAPPSSKDTLLTAQAIFAAFQAAGLPVDNLRQQPIQQGSPSGPPQTEREAWAFSIAGIAPSGGRILVFADDDKLKKKTDWFTRAGAGGRVEVQNNIVLWLDPQLSPAQDARYRQALHGIR